MLGFDERRLIIKYNGEAACITKKFIIKRRIIMTHPDIKFVERYGYTKSELARTKPIGVCLFCGSDIASGEYVKSFDGLFCNLDCCHSYYEIDIKD